MMQERAPQRQRAQHVPLRCGCRRRTSPRSPCPPTSTISGGAEIFDGAPSSWRPPVIGHDQGRGAGLDRGAGVIDVENALEVACPAAGY